MRSLIVCSLALITGPAVAAGGCGDGGGDAGRDGGAIDGGLVADAGAPDAGEVVSLYGAPCAADATCGLGGFCLDEDDEWPADGYCSKSGCLTDAGCGAGALCGSDGNCYGRCATDGGCPYEGQVCAASIEGGGHDFGHEGCFPGQLAVDGAPCASFADCHPSQYCDRDPWNTPGGVCTTAQCTPGVDATCRGDGHCFEFAAGSPVCVDACGDADCRQAEGYSCFTSVNRDLGSFCAVATQTGDACAGGSCGIAPWACLTDDSFAGADLPGGYCGALCDPGDPTTCNQEEAVCHDPDDAVAGDEHCVRRCTPADEAETCRTGEGYACQDLDGGAPGTIRGCVR